MQATELGRPIEILLAEDSAGDARLTHEALKAAKVLNSLHVVRDGAEALDFLLRRDGYADAPRPDLILLDLNMPRMNGRDALKAIKENPELALIPVVVLTTSDAEKDILESYSLHANCYVTKPVDVDQFVTVIRSIEDFWLTIVMLPPASSAKGAPG